MYRYIFSLLAIYNLSVLYPKSPLFIYLFFCHMCRIYLSKNMCLHINKHEFIKLPRPCNHYPQQPNTIGGAQIEVVQSGLVQSSLLFFHQ